MNEITFTLADEKYAGWVSNPIPAVNGIPTWYKDLESFYGGEKFKVEGRKTNQTAKRCIPMREAMTAGYYITTPADMMITKDPKTGESSFAWITYTDLVTLHDIFQIEGIPFTPEYEPIPFKFYNYFVITTPPGYSCLFVSPLMRPDIPFTALPGIVDTDKHDVPINFPFLLRNDFEGLVPKGTPIIQVIPFKREDWKSEISKTPITNLFQRLERQFSYATRAYKKLGTWSRRSYR